ncbi:MAG: hypothetical protein Q8R30_02860 [bacterium]|nr:hypothetical protein [bacterium]MDZ4285328.1 hypothetical protein [Candidatus Sungbacteria bacterium]
MRRYYDTKEGIEEMLESLELFNQLIRIREAAGRRGEELHDFYLLGRFLTHSSGHLLKWYPDYFPPERYKDVPCVLTAQEFEALVNQFGIDKNTMRRAHELHLPAIPPARMIDPINKESWTIETCHDATPIEKDDSISLDEYVGKTIGEVKEIVAGDREKLYEFYPLVIFNHELIDFAPDDNGYPLNQYGTRPRYEMTDDYIVRMDDIINVRIIQFFHKDTLETFQENESDKLVDYYADSIRLICESAGFTEVNVAFTPIPTYLIHHGDHFSHFITHVQMYFRTEAHQGSFGVILLENTMICLDLTATRITRHQLMDDADLLVDDSADANICFVSQRIMETFFKRIASLPAGD